MIEFGDMPEDSISHEENSDEFISDESSNDESGAAITLVEFFENVPPGTYRIVTDAVNTLHYSKATNYELHSPTLKLYCNECKAFCTFRVNIEQLVASSQPFYIDLGVVSMPQLRAWGQGLRTVSVYGCNGLPNI